MYGSCVDMVCELTEEGKHSNTAVLQLRLLVAHEVLLVAGGKVSGVEVAEGSRHTSLILATEDRGSGGGGSSGQNDRVDDVNHTVISDNIGLDNVGAVDLDTSRTDTNGDLGTVDSGNLLAVQGDNSLSKDLAGNDVVCEDGCELGDVLKKSLDGASWELGEGLIGGGEHSEGTRTFKGGNKASS